MLLPVPLVASDSHRAGATATPMPILSPSMAPHLILPARTLSIRPQHCSPRRCCSTISAGPMRPGALRTQSRGCTPAARPFRPTKAGPPQQRRSVRRSGTYSLVKRAIYLAQAPLWLTARATRALVVVQFACSPSPQPSPSRGEGADFSLPPPRGRAREGGLHLRGQERCETEPLPGLRIVVPRSSAALAHGPRNAGLKKISTERERWRPNFVNPHTQALTIPSTKLRDGSFPSVRTERSPRGAKSK